MDTHTPTYTHPHKYTSTHTGAHIPVCVGENKKAGVWRQRLGFVGVAELRGPSRSHSLRAVLSILLSLFFCNNTIGPGVRGRGQERGGSPAGERDDNDNNDGDKQKLHQTNNKNNTIVQGSLPPATLII